MPTQQFALDPDGPKRLTASWSFGLENFTLTLDGVGVGAATPEELKAGKHFALPDGSDLFACFRRSFGNQGLELTRNGSPLPGSNTDAATQVRTASQVLYFVGALAALFSIGSLVSTNEIFHRLGGGIGGVIEGVLFLALGFLTAKRSQVALLAGTAIYVIESVYTVVSAPSFSGGTIMRVLFVLMLFRGIKAMRELKAVPKPVAA